jgi:hypothetical protein
VGVVVWWIGGVLSVRIRQPLVFERVFGRREHPLRNGKNGKNRLAERLAQNPWAQ